jgi:hypothetical protein
MIKLRTWKPLEYTTTLHQDIDAALAHFWKMYEEYYDRYPPKDEQSVSLDSVMDMFQLTDMTVVKTIEKRRKRHELPDNKKSRQPLSRKAFRIAHENSKSTEDSASSPVLVREPTDSEQVVSGPRSTVPER